MKKLYILLMFTIIGLGGTLQAQEVSDSMPNKFKNGISFKALLMDYQSQNGGSVSAIKDYKYGFEIAYYRKLSDRLNLTIPFKFGNVNQDANDEVKNSILNRVAGLDVQAQYLFSDATARVNPYALGGLGFVYEFEGTSNIQVPLGLGVQFRIADNASINLKGEYRFSFAEDRNNLHYGLGFVYWLGKSEMNDEPKKEITDSDGDGIEDKLDLCPDLAGLKELNGCPDSDGDGVADFQDKCPDIAGLKSLRGCPDTDGDGVADMDDECPNIAGTIENKGCPKEKTDRDGDGVFDDEDNCPDIVGSPENDGCPKPENNDSDGDGVLNADDKCPNTPGLKVYNGCPDTDGDGLDDSIDRCPNTPGTVASQGCPEITTEDRNTLDVAMRAVQFDTGKASLRSGSYTILKQIANILIRYPDYNLSISGHTDNTGSPTANQDLSERRAKACYDYLLTQGVASNRMNFAGYGESRPIAGNDTPTGRTLNRRTEFTMIPK